MNRYSRQSILPEINQIGQQAISASSVLCIGAGGLGSAVLQYLAAAGVGRIGIVDGDLVSLSNLQRQVLFQESQLGMKKVDAAKLQLEKLNLEVKIEVFPEFLTVDNAEEIFSPYDILIDGTDNFEARYLINDTAVKLKKPVVFGSVTGFEGQVTIFDSATGPCYRCLYPEPPSASIPNCEESGVLGPVVGMIGTIQATECLKFIVSKVQPEVFQSLLGTLMMIDAREMSFFKTKIPQKCSCKIQVQVVEQLIDVREQEEWEISRREGAIHLPLSLLKKDSTCLARLDRGKNFATYCVSGARAKEAVKILEAHGFKNVRFLA